MLSVGVPYADALTLPLDFAIGLLTDGRPNNIRPPRGGSNSNANRQAPTASPRPSGKTASTVTKVAARRKHSRP